MLTSELKELQASRKKAKMIPVIYARAFLASIAVCRICLEAALIAEHGKKNEHSKTLIDKCQEKAKPETVKGKENPK